MGIKPKDVIGMGGDIIKMGRSLYSIREVNPELTSYITERNQEIPTKIIENIKIHLQDRLKNASGKPGRTYFKLNLKEIVNAKHPPKANMP